MCGIAGIVDFGQHRTDLRDTIERMTSALAHRGPYLISVEVTRDSEVSPWAFIHPPKP
jgi:asparagine synthetase B (glutamine-hydrolysing)